MVLVPWMEDIIFFSLFLVEYRMEFGMIPFTLLDCFVRFARCMLMDTVLNSPIANC